MEVAESQNTRYHSLKMAFRTAFCLPLNRAGVSREHAESQAIRDRYRVSSGWLK